ncbi:MAG: helix-turn-helix domain-containing protein [Candidatus Nitrosocosmicus sp.]|nr:helix-turn-helix domain-containing protein [Candidatus Nitrosocosmicus sp.]
MKSDALDKAYRNEHDVSVREKLLLIIRIAIDKQHIEGVASELHKSRAWAYKWYKRYIYEGLEGLKDKPRSGKPSFVDKEDIVKIRQELTSSNTGWSTKEAMNLIQNKTGIKYHDGHVRRLLYQWDLNSKYRRKYSSKGHQRRS